MPSCIKNLKKIIKECDCFGTFVTFRINRDNELRSLFGGCSTIVYSMIALIYVSYMSYHFIARKKIEFINAYRIVESEPFINLTDIGFNFAFGLESADTENPYVEGDIKFFNYSIFLIEWIGHEQIIKTKIPTKSCTKEDFHHLIDGSFKKSDLDKLFCPDWSGINYTLEGTYMDYYYKYIMIQIGLTEYALTHLDLTQKLFISNPFEMAFFFLDNAIDYDNRSKPMPLFLGHLFRTMDFNYQKTTEVLFSPVEFYNDENIIIDNPSLTRGLTIDSCVDSFRNSDRSVKHESLVNQFLLKTSSKIIELRRSYEKLPIFIADLTGILEDILIFLLLTVNIIERIAIDHKLISKMLKFKGSKYYDIDYLTKTFNKDNINSNVMKIINKQNLDIVKNGKGGLKSTRKSILTLLENKSYDKKHKNVIFVDNQGKKNNYLGNSDLNNLRSTMDFHSKNDKKNDNIEVKVKEIDGINLLNHSHRKSNNNSLSIESLSEISDVTHDIRGKEDPLNSNTERIFSTSKSIENFTPELEVQKINQKKRKKEVNYIRVSIFQTICAKSFFWIHNDLKKMKYGIKKAEDRVHYYLDVFNYIKKMQEIDLLTYCFLDHDQYKLFEYLSKPPVKFEDDKSNIYNEFLDRQITYKAISKKEIDQLYKSYNNIRGKDDILFEDIKLLRLVNAEVKFLS